MIILLNIFAPEFYHINLLGAPEKKLCTRSYKENDRIILNRFVFKCNLYVIISNKDEDFNLPGVHRALSTYYTGVME